MEEESATIEGSPEESTEEAAPESPQDEPRRWHLAVFTRESAELLKARAWGAPYKFGISRAAIPWHRAVGAECTDAEWERLIRGYKPVYDVKSRADE